MDDWSTLGDDAANMVKARYPGCGVGKLLDALGEEERRYLEHALARPELTNSAIEAALRKRMDTDVRAQGLGRHRRGACSCEG